jgi:hypothetical protein
MRHVRAARFCAAGMRTWLERHGFNAMQFFREGLTVEQLEATGDHFAVVVCAIAKAEAARG